MQYCNLVPGLKIELKYSTGDIVTALTVRPHYHWKDLKMINGWYFHYLTNNGEPVDSQPAGEWDEFRSMVRILPIKLK